MTIFRVVKVVFVIREWSNFFLVNRYSLEALNRYFPR